MGLDQCDKKMMAVSIPVVDYWSMREDLDRLEDAINRLEKIVEALILLHKEERVKNWEMILKEMLKKEEQKKGNYGNRTG